MATIDTTSAATMLRQARERLAGIHGKELPDRRVGKSRTAELAEINRELLFVAHLCERARLSVMDEYWQIRGEEPEADAIPVPIFTEARL